MPVIQIVTQNDPDHLFAQAIPGLRGKGFVKLPAVPIIRETKQPRFGFDQVPGLHALLEPCQNAAGFLAGKLHEPVQIELPLKCSGQLQQVHGLLGSILNQWVNHSLSPIEPRTGNGFDHFFFSLDLR